MIKAGVVGATGYTGCELVECLYRHPEVEIVSLSALVDKPEAFSAMFPKFGKKVDVVCKNLDIDEISGACDIVFLALPHTVSMKVAPKFLERGRKVIDLSADYRLPADVYEKWYGTKHIDEENLSKAVYGLPELNRDSIKTSVFVANPGCYPTSVILALLPMAKMLSAFGIAPIVDSKSGATGAGRKAAIPLCFGEIDENIKCYKPNAHQHMPEMEHVLRAVAGGDVKVNFIPHLMPIRRGIMSTIYVQAKDLPGADKLRKLYAEYYSKEHFVRVAQPDSLPQVSDVAGTNFCDIGIKVSGGLVTIVSVIDNLLKGASGQAVQNMNIMYGTPEKMGLS
ncbi:MAG: N-acetyl-gamma-glutamyl-phosphate reductase [Candidatus Omnitrophica bacterium]|nr:N-acetyl-gamma-glutamyl-phosphate reductase [Candidatus Omnitrophota bacterium]MBU1127981.1 N-acetyl-gamma-glutamyl-phosphate reductase [Candidatus Omnitrophota bacterium]MBU1656694.1 N-acetyl-gamma-glutamyl-phosphate reductase [Candidatus Omnitrophota bacterium]MBU1784846.1 N-acetyl-gamma-glutamyl-phosphate reductase [Candidatus Omnitrophota bacterium]MBU1851698.1 N-acetyl-gamma-glutamyl-phosphate reductase [Candidatus Omnitrophota bacterium]